MKMKRRTFTCIQQKANSGKKEGMQLIIVAMFRLCFELNVMFKYPIMYGWNNFLQKKIVRDALRLLGGGEMV